MTTSQAVRSRRGSRRRQARRGVLLMSVLVIVAIGLGGCGDGSAPGQAAGNATAGRFHPPPIQTHVDEADRKACGESLPTIDRIKKAGVLFWAIGVSPPFGFEVSAGKWAGVEAQNAADLATILGVDYDIAEYSYDVLPEAVVTGQADIVGAELFVTAERRALIDFSRPYYQSGQLFYVLADSPYRTIADLDKPSVTFVYGTGTAQLDLARKYVPQAKVTDTPLGHRLLLQDVLAAGRADATMSQAAAMAVILDTYKRPPLAAIGRRGRVTTKRATRRDMLDPFDVAFGLPKGDAGWRGCVNAWVGDLVRSGRMAARLDYWLAQPVT